MFSGKIKSLAEMKAVLNRNINSKKKMIQNQEKIALPEVQLRESSSIGEVTAFAEIEDTVPVTIDLQVLRKELEEFMLNGNELLSSWRDIKKKYINDPYDPIIQNEIDVISTKYINSAKIGNKRLTKVLSTELNVLLKSLLNKISNQIASAPVVTQIPAPAPAPAPSPIPAPSPAPEEEVPDEEIEEVTDEEIEVAPDEEIEVAPDEEIEELTDVEIEEAKEALQKRRIIKIGIGIYADKNEPFTPIGGFNKYVGGPITEYFNLPIHIDHKDRIEATICNNNMFSNYIRAITFVFLKKHLEPQYDYDILLDMNTANIDRLIKLFNLIKGHPKSFVPSVHSNSEKAVQHLLFPENNNQSIRHNFLIEQVNEILREATEASGSGLKRKSKVSKKKSVKKKNGVTSTYINDKSLISRSKNLINAIGLKNDGPLIKNELDSIFSTMVERKLIKPKEVLILTKRLNMV
jgi:hypothetical protein